MNILSKYINYSIIAQNSPEYWEKGLLIERKEKSYYDKSILKIKNICESDYELLKKLAKGKFTFYSEFKGKIRLDSKTNTNANTNANTNRVSISETVYTQDNSNDVFIFEINIVWEYYCWSIDIIGLIDETNNKYFILGCNSAHPYLITNNFSYYNSDGSGPDVTTTDEIELASNIKYYFKKFMQNKYH